MGNGFQILPEIHWDFFDALSQAIREGVIERVEFWAPHLPASHSTSAFTCLMYLASFQDCLKQEFLGERAFWLAHLSPHWSPVFIPLIWLAQQVSPSSLTVPCTSLPKLCTRSKRTTFPSQIEEDGSSVKDTWAADSPLELSNKRSGPICRRM